mgnify:CR=1 FL=1
MKSLNCNNVQLQKTILFSVFFLSFTFIGFGQNKIKKDESFYSKIIMLKPEMTKGEVLKLMGDPYKISFCNNEKQEFMEELFYKTSVYNGKWYVITYQCVLVNNKLKSLSQKEMILDGSNIQITN